MRADLDARRTRALELLAEGMTPGQVAAAMRLSPRTLYRYLSNGTLRAALRELQSERLEALANKMMAATAEAVTALRDIAADHDAHPVARVQAAARIIEHSLKLFESVQLDQRIAELERQADDVPALPTPTGSR